MQKVLHSETLKLLAVVAMLVDHVGLALYPEQMGFRIFGRLAFPLFAYQIVIGFHKTRNKKKMLERLLLFFVLSQLPYMWMIGTTTLNIFATLSLAFVAMWALECRRFWLLPFVLGFVYFVPVDYGFYGVFLILTLYVCNKFKKLYFRFMEFVVVYLMTGVYCVFLGTDLQMYALFGYILGPLLVYIPDWVKINKYFYYAFYPGHMAAIALVAFLT